MSVAFILKQTTTFSLTHVMHINDGALPALSLVKAFPSFSFFLNFHLNVIFCAADSRNLFDLEWQSGIWLSPVFCTWPLLPYSRSNLISWTDRKRRQSLPLLSVSLIPMEHNFIFSQHCFVSHPWLLPPRTLLVFQHSESLKVSQILSPW